MQRMPEFVTLIAFILLAAGTTGLLLNEFMLHWGTAATLSFAAISVIGFVAFGVTCLTSRRPGP